MIEVLIDERDVPDAPGTAAADRRDDDEDDDGQFAPGSHLAPNSGGQNDADAKIKQRIIKLLNTGFHDTSNEHEARNAMKLARRLMNRHNLCQAALLKEREEANSRASDGDGDELRGGLVEVRLVNRRTGKSLSSLARWIDHLIGLVRKNFGVEAYKTVSRASRWREGLCSVTFYGIYANAQLAGYAFKVAAERISAMSAAYDPSSAASSSRSWGWGAASKAAATKTARLSYALGVVRGLVKDVEEQKRREEEARARKLARARAAVRTGEAYEESDGGSDEDDDDDGGGEGEGGGGFTFAGDAPEEPPEEEREGADGSDGGDAGDQSDPASVPAYAPPDADLPDAAAPASTPSEPAATLRRLEREQSLALTLVDRRSRIAEDVLRERDIKVRKAAKRRAINFDRRAYEKGEEDAKEIDLMRRAIRDEARGVKMEETT